MTPVFVDTSCLVAFLNPNDEHHAGAFDGLVRLSRPLVTSGWVLAELGNFLAKGGGRRLFAPFVAQLARDPRIEIVPADAQSFEAGLKLYGERSDKEWSFVDCVSFAIMGRRNIIEALTADHHFEQAGFQTVLT